MTNNIKIARTLLSLWPDLDNYYLGIEKQIFKSAMASYGNPDNTMQIIDKIIELTMRKDVLRALARDINATIGGLPPVENELLHKFYLTRDKTAREFSAQLGMPLRSFYRKVSNAVQLFSQRLPNMGINTFTWERLLSDNPWFKTVFDNDAQTE